MLMSFWSWKEREALAFATGKGCGLRGVLPMPLAWLAILLVFCLASPAKATVVVDAMSVMVQMTKEDLIVVTERFEATVSEDRSNHGMYRTIPLKPRFEGLERQKVGFRVMGVFIDGKPYPTDDVKQIDGGVCVYMRDQKRWLAKGKHVFWLRYETTQQVAFFEDHDELTWNAVGSEWKDGVGRASCLVLAPEGASISDDRAWTGKVGSKESEVERFRGRSKEGLDAVLYRTTGPVRPGCDFTVAVSLPKGHIAEPVPYRPEEDLPFTLASVLCLAATALTTFLLWHFRGRDPRTGPVTPLFYPPRLPNRLKGGDRKSRFLSAAAVSYLYSDGNDIPKFCSTGFAALLLQLQAKGKYALKGNAKTCYVLEQPGGKPRDFEPLSPEEESVLDRFRGSALRFDAVDDARILLSMWDAARDCLEAEFPRMYEPCIAEITASFTLSWWCFLLLSFWHELAVWGFDWKALSLSSVTWTLACATCPPALAWVAAIFSPVGWGELKGKYIMAPLLALAAMALASDLSWSDTLQKACAFCILAIPLLFAPFMGRPSVELAELKRQIKGFAMYLRATETDSLNLINSPEEDLVLYTRYLPYAVALHCEDAWGWRFAGQLSLLGETASEALDGAGISALRHNLEESLSKGTAPIVLRGGGDDDTPSSVRSTSSSGSVSSFSREGGGSGSGGGGGGGGGC